MRSKKWSIIISFIIMGVSVLIFSILNFRLYTISFKNWIQSFVSSTALSDWKSFFIIISSGAFTSSIVTLLISISEYRVEKRIALENYADANIHFCADFYNMQYLNIDMPVNLLQGYYAEQWNYPPIEIYQGEISAEQSRCPIFETKIKEWIWDNTSEKTKELLNTDEKREEYLDSNLKSIIQKCDDEIDSIMKQYIDLGDKVSKRELNAAIGGIDFLFGNKYRKDILHKEMYEKHSEVINKIRDVAYHFKEYYKVTEGNKPVMLQFIKQIQDYLFSIEENAEWRIVYNRYLFEINCEIDNLLRKLYGKKKYHDEPPRIKDFTVTAYWKGKHSHDEQNTQEVC